jgi:hypothetical protein
MLMAVLCLYVCAVAVAANASSMHRLQCVSSVANAVLALMLSRLYCSCLYALVFNAFVGYADR